MFLMIQKVIEKAFKYEFLQISHPKSQMLRSQKSNFSEISTFSKLNVWMSYSKDEFLSVRTHPFDVNWPFSTFGDDLLNIYGLWNKSWNFSFWKIFFRISNFQFWNKIFNRFNIVAKCFLSVYNDQICLQNFSATLTWRSHDHPQLFLKMLKNNFLMTEV